MKNLITFENFNRLWHVGLGLNLPPISKQQLSDIKKRMVIYGKDALQDCPKCGELSIYPPDHSCLIDDSDLPDLQEEIKESADELNQIVDYLVFDLQEEGFSIRRCSIQDFLDFKYKNIKDTSSRLRVKDKAWRLKRKEVDVITKSDYSIYSISGTKSFFNLYDVVPHVRRLLDESKSLGYNHFEIRKITQMSRKSQDVTSQFIGGRPLLSTAKKEVIVLQILIMK